VESEGKSDVNPAGRQATVRDHEIEIWMMCAMGVLVHVSQGSSKGVRFTVQLSNVCHMKRLLLVNPREAGFIQEQVKILEGEGHAAGDREKNALFYRQPGPKGPEGPLMQTSTSNLKLASDWKARNCQGDPRRGTANDAYGSQEFVFHTLRVRTQPIPNIHA
jgi:hypothetical protein